MMPSLTSLAEEILINAKRLDEHLAAQKQSPSFDHDAWIDLPPQLESVRDALIDSTHTLKQLTQGPVRATANILFNWTDFLSLRAIYTYKLPHAVPIDGYATYQEIAATSGLSESMTHRFLRHAMANRIFTESSDHVRHTAASRLMVTDPDFFDAVGLQTSDLGPASASIFEALLKYGDSGEPNETAFSLANGTNLGIYQILGQSPERARRFGAGMRFFTKDEGWNLKHLVTGFDWTAIDYPGAVVVDVGGGQGSVSQALAKATQYIHFVVLDLPGTVAQGKAALPKEFDSRIEFIAHDFFTEQATNNSNAPKVYLFRWILHNWSDGYCVKILRSLIPSLGGDTRVVIYEYVLNDEPETRLTEKMGLNTDMIMAACFNGAERTKAQWTGLLQKADERFVIENIIKPQGSTMSIIEVVWRQS